MFDFWRIVPVRAASGTRSGSPFAAKPIPSFVYPPILRLWKRLISSFGGTGWPFRVRWGHSGWHRVRPLEIKNGARI